MHTKPTVTSVEDAGGLVYIVRREIGDLRVRLTNIYIVSEADVVELLQESRPIDAIVTMSMWNSYTAGAKRYALAEGVGLFTMPELNGAVFYGGSKFIRYVPPERRA
jgi:hypothetical protein